jgi:hypothetical protein
MAQPLYPCSAAAGIKGGARGRGGMTLMTKSGHDEVLLQSTITK